MKRTILALGTIALALGLTGGAWAGKRYIITSSHQVKPGSLTLKDLSKGTLKHLRGAKGKTGATGSQGPQGPKGDTGDSGVNSPLVYTFAGATGPDTGVCSDNNGSPNQGWATDTYNATYVVAMQPDGSYVVTKTVKGTFVTTAGVSEPNNCGSLQAGGVIGNFYGTESITVPADSGFDPYASCGASCSPDTNTSLTSSNTAQNNAFVAAFFRSGVTGALSSFDFTYGTASNGHMEQNDNGVTGNITG